MLSTKLSPETTKILGEEFKISFHGAIAPVYHKDDYRDAVGRLEQCYLRTRDPSSVRKVYWWKDEEKNLPPKDFRTAIYKNAIKEFAIIPPDGNAGVMESAK